MSVQGHAHSTGVPTRNATRWRDGTSVQHTFRMTATLRRADRVRMRHLARACAMAASGEGRRISEEAGVSLTPMAAATGASVPTLSRWERGLAKPRGDTAIRWVMALDELAGAVTGGDLA